MKVEVSPDLEGDADLVDIQDEYDKLIDQFKLIHKEHENLSMVGRIHMRTSHVDVGLFSGYRKFAP